MKKFLLLFGIVVLLFIGVLTANAFLFQAELPSVPPADEMILNENVVAERLSRAIEFETVSYQNPAEFRALPFADFHEFLEQSFPLTHAVLDREVINNYSLLYQWRGTNSDLKPLLLTAHMDVVPAGSDAMTTWQYLPFGGRVDHGYIWGRGTLDDKSSLLGIMESIEKLLNEGYQPERTVFLAFGHDEEIGGMQGAAAMADSLKSRGFTFEFVLDEGGMLTSGVIPDVDQPVALIGIAEKGYLTLELTVQGQGGHSSAPPKWTTAGRLSRAVTVLEENPFPVNMKYARQMLENVGPFMPFSRKLIMANLWLFQPILRYVYSESPELNATIRTTTAPTMLSGGIRENVLPRESKAVVNFRIIPGESMETVTERVRKLINDPEVEVRVRGNGSNPSPVSGSATDSYKTLAGTIRQTRPEAGVIITPYLVIGATDARYYVGLSDKVYRYVNYKLQPEDLDRIHGVNERISIDEYTSMIEFYCQLIKNSDNMEVE